MCKNLSIFARQNRKYGRPFFADYLFIYSTVNVWIFQLSVVWIYLVKHIRVCYGTLRL